MARPSEAVRIPMVVLALASAAGAMVILVFRTAAALATYGVGGVPLAVPWLAAVMIVVVAVTGLSRFSASSGATVAVAIVVVLTAWSDGALMFDALRVVRLVPLPLNGWGFALRLLLLVGTVLGTWPVVEARHASQGRCPSCRRWRPGPLGRLPRWPALVGVVFALPYPVLRVTWLLGGTLGTTGERVQADRTLQLVMATAGVFLVALATVLLIDRGPTWLR
ncbi:MAG TPA: hypothetical protein VLS51_03970, partial [Propionibacteriaceae bacterium]|nr:hypothetical protein [Propionibacteriaceae bacterium]